MQQYASGSAAGPGGRSATLWLGTRVFGEEPLPLPGHTVRHPHSDRTPPVSDGAERRTSRSNDDEQGSDTVEQILAEHPAIVTIGRIGWVAKGIVYGLAGLLAATVAAGWRRSDAGQPQGEASVSGGIAAIAATRFGSVALALIAVGLLLYALWRVVAIALPADDGAETWLTRLGYAVSAGAHVALAWTCVTYIRSPGRSGSAGQTEDARVERLTRSMLEHAFGRPAIGAVGVIVVSTGVVFAYKGLRRHFKDQLNPAAAGAISYRSLVALGRAGWIGRGTMMSLVGFFLARAAWRFNPDEAGGLDSALRQAVDHPAGAVLAWVAASGLVLYGVYCVLAAPLKRLAPADE